MQRLQEVRRGPDLPHGGGQAGGRRAGDRQERLQQLRRCIGPCHFDALDEGTYGYKIYIGGRWGKKVAQGRALSKVFTDKEEALAVIEKAILLFREQGKTGERFAKTIERLGFENVEAQLLGNELLERKHQILDAELHVSGGATC